MLPHGGARRPPLSLLMALTTLTAGCTAAPSTSTPSRPPASPSASPVGSPSPGSSAANPNGSFSFSGWLTAANVGPVDPLPFATLIGGVPNVPLTSDAAGHTLSGAAPGTQCYHASSRDNLDQFEVLLVFVVRGQRYLLSVVTDFTRPGLGVGGPSPPAGGRMTDVGGNNDELHFDPESVTISDDPMFLASFNDGAVVIAPTLRSGSIDVTLRGIASPGRPAPALHVTGTWTCP